MESKKKDKKENALFSVCATNKIKMQIVTGNNVIFFCNEDFLCSVNRQHLLENSAYFRAILKPCYRDHLSDHIQMEIPATY